MAFLNGVLMLLLLLTAVFLIVLVLIQRGKGGGLAGAFGGLGGQSAFGTKAGDLFTKITIGVAAFWIILCAFTVWELGRGGDKGPLGEMGAGGEAKPGASVPATPGKQPAANEAVPATPAKTPAKGN
jgi:preprotein translocase subunit SecG